MNVSAPADARTTAPARPTLELAPLESDRHLAMAATCIWDADGWRMLQHWHGVPYPGEDASARELSEAQRLQVGSVWTLVGSTLARDGLEAFLVLVDQRIAGLRAIYPTKADGVYSTGGWLSPEARGRGFGAKVLSTTTRYACERGARYVSTATRPDNAAARANLAACGFVPTPHLEDPDKDRAACGEALVTYTFAVAGADPHACPDWR